MSPDECLDDERVLALCNGTLSEDEVARIDAHVDGCSQCRRLLADVARAQAPASQEPKRVRLNRGAAVGRYRIDAEIGSGAMGVVYSAHDPALDRRIALKFIGDPRRGDASNDLEREARMLAKLHHPNVLAVHDVGMFEERLFIATELVEGGTVRAWFHEAPRSWRQTLQVFVAAGEGLAAAHAAGVIHRDFKPDNILLHQDGRVVVTDFGLATGRHPGSRTSQLPLEAASMVSTVGPLRGTPAYMAPELAEEDGSEETDQFAFCLSLWEALYGERPYAAATFGEHLEAARAERIATPRARGVPNAVRRVLLRGLRREPSRRFPSMAALVLALRRLEGRRRRVVRSLALGGVLGVGVGVPLLLVSESPPSACEVDGDPFDGMWSTVTASRAQAAFERTNLPYAADVWRRVVRALDDYQAQWEAAYTQTCRALQQRTVPRPQSFNTLACLERQRAELQAVSRQFVDADARTVEAAVAVVDGLRTPGDCAEEAPLPTPAEPEVREAVESIRGEMAGIQAALRAGHPEVAADLASTLESRAAETSFEPLLAEALLLLGDVARKRGQYDVWLDDHRQAVRVAEASGHDTVKARAALGLSVALCELGEYDDAHHWADLAESTLVRVGNPPRLQARLAYERAYLFQRQWKHEEALAQALLAARLLEASDSRNRGHAYHTVAMSLRFLGRLDEALDYERRALAVAEDAQGNAHPDTGRMRAGFGLLLAAAGDYERGLAEVHEGLAIVEASLGPENQGILDTLLSLGSIQMELGDYDAAIATFHRCGNTVRAAHEPLHPMAAPCDYGLGVARLALGQADAALQALQSSLRTAEASEADDSGFLADTRFAVARAMVEAGGSRERAEVLARRAAAVYAARAEDADRRAEVERWMNENLAVE